MILSSTKPNPEAQLRPADLLGHTVISWQFLIEVRSVSQKIPAACLATNRARSRTHHNFFAPASTPHSPVSQSLTHHAESEPCHHATGGGPGPGRGLGLRRGDLRRRHGGAVVRGEAGAVRGFPQLDDHAAGDLLRAAQGRRVQRDQVHVRHAPQQGGAAGVRRRAGAGHGSRQAMRRHRRRIRVQKVHRRRCGHRWHYRWIFHFHGQPWFYSDQTDSQRRHRAPFVLGRRQFHLVDDHGVDVCLGHPSTI